MNARLYTSHLFLVGLAATFVLAFGCEDKSDRILRVEVEQGSGAAATPTKSAEAKPDEPPAMDQPAKTAPAAAAKQLSPDSPLLHPEKATLKAPAKYTVKLETTKGDILIDVTRAWSPNGADRFYNLVKVGFLDDSAIFRAIEGFMAQVGIHGNPQVSTAWRSATIEDDAKSGQSNTPGMVSFAKTGAPNSRSTQIFINFGNNANLDSMGFTPIGKVRDMKIVNKINTEYGEGAPRGRGPSQGLIQSRGNEYLRSQFPGLDYIKTATIVQ